MTPSKPCPQWLPDCYTSSTWVFLIKAKQALCFGTRYSVSVSVGPHQQKNKLCRGTVWRKGHVRLLVFRLVSYYFATFSVLFIYEVVQIQSKRDTKRKHLTGFQARWSKQTWTTFNLCWLATVVCACWLSSVVGELMVTRAHCGLL